MELKLNAASNARLARQRFNRTFMELKSALDFINYRTFSFNRTFMELKYICTLFLLTILLF